MFKRSIASLSLLLILHSAYSQDSLNKQVVLVTLDIVGKGAPAACIRADTSDYYFATINILNTQDTTVSFFVFSCSWSFDAFFIKSDSIAFRDCFCGCDSNIPNKISIPPHKAVQFYSTIKSWKKTSSIARIKLGFRYFPTFDDLWYFGIKDYHKKSKNIIFWSNEVELKDNLYSYEIK